MFIISFIPTLLFAQPNNSFQQEVNHKITVELNPITKSLNAFIETEYINNSPDTLFYIYYHLWPDAYRDNNSEFAQQQLLLGRTDFYYSNPWQRGYIDSLDFIVDGNSAVLEATDFGNDVKLLVLPQKLYPGDTAFISTPFYVKIPQMFSRLGYDQTTFCLTQWYPKPAVYDKFGWHPMPYLDMGEFYSEFGSFDVEITVPDNYIVASGADLKTKSELMRLEDYSLECEKTKYKGNMSSFGNPEKTKTLVYQSDNMHDFAWFTSPDFVVQLEYFIPFDGGQSVCCQTFYNKNSHEVWKNSLTYIKQSLSFYSEQIGPYPYSNCVVVEGPLSAGGGMEYPGITVVTASNAGGLESVAIHEIGHNWFYGILASNERNDPWIDEGFTSYYECRYMDFYHPEEGIFGRINENAKGIGGINAMPERFIRGMAWMYLIKENIDQSSLVSSEKMSPPNYFIMSYYKPVTFLYMLEKYLGAEKFKALMNEFYAKNKFTHIYPETVSEFFESHGDTVCKQYFDEMLLNNELPDYKIIRQKGDSIVVKNKRTASGPLFLSIGDSLIIHPGFEGKMKFENRDEEKVFVDKELYCPDYNRSNNYFAPGMFKSGRKLKLRFFGTIDYPEIAEIPLMPFVGFNAADGFMPGLVFYSLPVPKHRFEYVVAPLYGTRSANITGKADFRFYIHPKTKYFREIELFCETSSFAQYRDSSAYRIRNSSGIKFIFKTEPSLPIHSEVVLRNVVANDFVTGDLKYFQTLKFSYGNFRKINPWSATINIDRGNGFAKAGMEFKYKLSYLRKNQGLKIRVFGGKFLYNSPVYYGNYNFRLSGNAGFQDYLYDDIFVSRSDDIRFNPQMFWSHQFIRNDGGFTLYTPYGQTNNWLTALNLDSSTPLKFLDVYFNTALCPSISNDKFADFYYEAGVSVKIWQDFLCVYFPITATNAVWKASNDIYTDNYLQKIRFTLSLAKINFREYRSKPFLLF